MSTTYEGLTHTCDDPDCHVAGFVATLRLKAADEEDRADRLERMLDRLAERLAELPDLWREEGRAVMFNRAGDDLTPAHRVGKWLHEKTTPATEATR